MNYDKSVIPYVFCYRQGIIVVLEVRAAAADVEGNTNESAIQFLNLLEDISVLFGSSAELGTKRDNSMSRTIAKGVRQTYPSGTYKRRMSP